MIAVTNVSSGDHVVAGDPACTLQTKLGSALELGSPVAVI
jgi:hypothetical protein